MTPPREPLLILVRGIGDVASAVAHRLFLDGHAVAMHDGPAPPTAYRRGMAFAEAVFDGEATLDGVVAHMVDRPGSLVGEARRRASIAVATGSAEAYLSAAAWDTDLGIGQVVTVRQLVGRVGREAVTASVGGVLRGLTRGGVPVDKGTKLVEVDPRGPERAQVRGIGERPRRIAEGVARYLVVEP